MTVGGHVTRDPTKEQSNQRPAEQSCPLYETKGEGNKRATVGELTETQRGPRKGRGAISQTVRAGAKWTPDLGSPLVKLCIRSWLICHTMGGNPSKAKVPLRYPRGN